MTRSIANHQLATQRFPETFDGPSSDNECDEDEDETPGRGAVEEAARA